MSVFTRYPVKLVRFKDGSYGLSIFTESCQQYIVPSLTQEGFSFRPYHYVYDKSIKYDSLDEVNAMIDLVFKNVSRVDVSKMNDLGRGINPDDSSTKEERETLDRINNFFCGLPVNSFYKEGK